MPLAASATLRAATPGPVVHRNLYGHFAEHLGRGIYEGLWVGPDSPIPNTRGIRDDVLAALKALDIPVLRWPGGCFADEYHWKDGIGPREQRPRILNTHWGAVVENNHFGTHEFMDLCEQLGCEPYICGNVGSGEVREMMEWVEYLTSDASSPMADLRRKNGREKPWRVRYFGVGNESWGCGGSMRPEYYADEYRRYNTFCKNHSGNQLYRIACGANVDDYRWTEELMREAGRNMDGLSLHYYTLPTGWPPKESATQFDEPMWHLTLSKALHMETLIRRHGAIMDVHDPEKRVGMIIDEWGTWFAPEPGSTPGFLYQQNTLRDALVAALHFHIFHRHADRVVMTNIAQTVNVLQAMILTDGPRMLRTPTYWVFEMFKAHQGGTTLPVDLHDAPAYSVEADASGATTGPAAPIPAVSASATRRAADGVVHVSLANLHPRESARVELRLDQLAAKRVSGRVLTASAMNAHNTFDAPDAVRPARFTGATLADRVLVAELPPMSVVALELA